MLKRLEIEALSADLEAVSERLAVRDLASDPLGYMQFTARKDYIQKQLDEVKLRPAKGAAVGLFFGGRPVVGSRAIVANFGADAINHFQKVVTTRFAELAGPVGTRGPLKQRDQSELLLTDIARGSFGFLLEEAEQREPINSGMLKEVTEEVVDLIFRTAEEDAESFNKAAEAVDDRVLNSMRTFFQHLDANGATLRLVDDTRDFLLQADAIHRARERVDNVTITDTKSPMRGRLYLFPDSRKFELIEPSGTALRGAVTPECLQSVTGEDGEIISGILGQFLDVEMEIRSINLPGQAPRFGYKLLGILGDKKPSLVPKTQ